MVRVEGLAGRLKNQSRKRGISKKNIKKLLSKSESSSIGRCGPSLQVNEKRRQRQRKNCRRNVLSGAVCYKLCHVVLFLWCKHPCVPWNDFSDCCFKLFVYTHFWLINSKILSWSVGDLLGYVGICCPNKDVLAADLLCRDPQLKSENKDDDWAQNHD